MITIKRILCPTDFSDPGRTALLYARAFAEQFNADVELLHVMDPIPPGALLSYFSHEELRTHMRLDAEAKMQELVTEWGECSFPVTQTVLGGHPFVEIIRRAKEDKADMIIMGTHGRGAIAHMLLGSVAEKVVRKAPCPVLTVRQPEHEFVHPAD